MLPPSESIPGAVLKQRFGIAVSTVASMEPAMWHTADRAFWVPFPGSVFSAHFHPGEDWAAPEGTPVYAREAGTVTDAGYHNSISGNVVRVEIRPGVSRYGANHLSKVLVKVGQHVAKGQLLGLVGHSGATTGNHAHTYLEIYEKGIGWVCYNPTLFEPGGKLRKDPRIQPLPAPSAPDLVVLKGPGINIRISPDLDVGTGNLFGTSRADGTPDGGIYAYPSGKLIHTNIKTGFLYRRDVSNDDGTWVEVWGFNRVLYIYKPLVNIIVR